MPLELDEDGEIINTTFAPGSSGAVTVVRSMYRCRFVTPIIAEEIPAALGGHMLLSTVAFHNDRSEEHTSELQSLIRLSYAVFCLKKKKNNTTHTQYRSAHSFA